MDFEATEPVLHCGIRALPDVAHGRPSATDDDDSVPIYTCYAANLKRPPLQTATLSPSNPQPPRFSTIAATIHYWTNFPRFCSQRFATAAGVLLLLLLLL
ncbi:hypothetical protein J3458_022154 [Metarhizium acridum]|uniref:uncharacterized protein n=1 Tax=Metarhizium acridum TaxID=92637 RepID=UPI001C6B1BC4|nr:hypothetical protein J3458_022154 [Metarhizium acridum]